MGPATESPAAVSDPNHPHPDLCVPQEELLILEDDMEVLRWPTREALAAAPEAAGALQLYMLGNTANELYSRPPSTWVPWAPGIFNTGAYVINRRGMQRVRDLGCRD